MPNSNSNTNSSSHSSLQLIAFSGSQRVASGAPARVIAALQERYQQQPDAQLLILDAHTSKTVELDLRQPADQVLAALGSAPGQDCAPQSASAGGFQPAEGSQPPDSSRPSDGSRHTKPTVSGDAQQRTAAREEPPRRGRGRPKLGVVSREVTLLPRHWDWLAAQPGGASVALRKLVEEARKGRRGEDRRRAARDSAYRFMTTLAGDEPGYEEAIRALYADDWHSLQRLLTNWPQDIATHARTLAEPAFAPADDNS